MLGLPKPYKSQPIMTRKIRYKSEGSDTHVYRAGLLTAMAIVSGSGTAGGSNTMVASCVTGVRLKRLEVFASPPASGLNEVVLRLEGGRYGSNRELVSMATTAGIQSVSYSPKADEALGLWSNLDATASSNNSMKETLFSISGDAGFVLDITIEFVLSDVTYFGGALAGWSIGTGKEPGMYLIPLDYWNQGCTGGGNSHLEPVGAEGFPVAASGITLIY